MSILRKLGFSVLLTSWLIMLTLLFLPNVEASPTDWSIETVDASLNVGGHNSIAIDSGGFPHIAYFDHHWLNLKYATRSPGPDWVVTLADTSGAVGQFLSLLNR